MNLYLITEVFLTYQTMVKYEAFNNDEFSWQVLLHNSFHG